MRHNGQGKPCGWKTQTDTAQSLEDTSNAWFLVTLRWVLYPLKYVDRTVVSYLRYKWSQQHRRPRWMKLNFLSLHMLCRRTDAYRHTRQNSDCRPPHGRTVHQRASWTGEIIPKWLWLATYNAIFKPVNQKYTFFFLVLLNVMYVISMPPVTPNDTVKKNNENCSLIIIK